MAYDFAGPWSPTAGHHAQLFPGSAGEPSGSTAVEYVISTGFRAQKILLGVPVYGRSFLGATGPGQSYSGTAGEDGTFEYKDLPRPGTEEVIDRRVVAAFCTGGDGGFVTYDNPETVKVKAGYCREKRLGVSCFLACRYLVTNETIGTVLLDWHRECPSRSQELNIGGLQGAA
jgi:chitinase